jgi:hypothetical protein
MIINDFKKKDKFKEIKKKQKNPLKLYIEELSDFENNLFLDIRYNNLKPFKLSDLLKK